MLVGTDVCVPVVFVCEETGVPGGYPPVWLGNHMIISHADADADATAYCWLLSAYCSLLTAHCSLLLPMLRS